MAKRKIVEVPSVDVNTVVEAADSDESETHEGGKRGPRGPRQVCFWCAGTVTAPTDDEVNGLKAGETGLVLAKIDVTMPDNREDALDINKAREEAVALFSEQYGCEPERVSQPSYLYKRNQAAPAQPRDSIRFDKLAAFTGSKGEAIHVVNKVPWKVLVQFTQRDGEAFIVYQKPTIPLDKKMQKPMPRGIKTSALQSISLLPME